MSQKNLELKHGTRLFRKLTTSTLVPGQPVGKNTLATIGVSLAELLELPDHKKYTGHYWRRTAATLAAESGSTLAEIKTLTGHNSDTVAYGYIANSNLLILYITSSRVGMNGWSYKKTALQALKRRSIKRNYSRIRKKSVFRTSCLDRRISFF